MKKIRHILIMLVALCGFTNIQAQEGNIQVNYNVGLPVGDFKDYVGKASWNGFDFRIGYAVLDELEIGVRFAYQDFYERKDRATYYDNTNPRNAVNAVITRSIQSMPFMFYGQYNLELSKQLMIYGGVGLGANFVFNEELYGEFSSIDNKTSFMLAPEIGARYALTDYVSFNLGLNYSHTFYDGLGTGAMGFFQPVAGFTFKY